MTLKFHLFLCLFFVCPTAILAVDTPIRVAIFQGAGASASAEKLIAAIQDSEGQEFEISRISPEEIHGGKLADVDVLVHPGGCGGKQGKALGKNGREAVRNFVREGGGYLAVCAGAYLATNDYDWSLKLIDAKVVDRRHWARGNGSVEIQLSPSGCEFFGHDESKLMIRYAQGPLLGRREWDNPDVPDYESLAIYSTEIAKNDAPQGVMARTSAVVRCDFESGRVFCFSPHPESTEGLQHMIPLAIEWLAAQNSQTKIR